MSHTICDSCETVAHCRKHGCIPLQPYAQTAAYIESATHGRVHVDPVTGDVGIGKKQLYNPEPDVRELHKWLNEEPNHSINRPALARVLAYLQGYHK